jgi:spore germination protein GerM
MARRTAHTLFRLLPALLVAGATIVLAAAVLVAACGGDSGSGETQGATPVPAETVTVTASPSASPSATPAAGKPTTVRVYFLRDEKLGVAQRQVPHTVAVATAAMEALCDGPTASERAAGLGSAVPEGTTLNGISIASRVATVDLSSRFATGGGSLSMMARVTQVVYTLTQFPTIRAVTFVLNGEPVEALGGEGLIVDTPQRRADWREFEPPIFVETPGVGAVLPDPFTLRGTASVFEGSFTAQLVDSSGRRIARAQVQASMGAPERGVFRESMAYSTSARRGWLVVYETSMKDGSRLNLVRIPVRFGG